MGTTQGSDVTRPNGALNNVLDTLVVELSLLFLRGESKYEFHFNAFDELSPSQKSFAENHLKLFERWWDGWEGKNH